MTEFDSLFGSVWRGEAPAEALADWVRERLDQCPFSAAYHYGAGWVHFEIKAKDGTTHEINLWEPELGTGETICLHPEDFGRLPTWLTEQIGFLYYVLSK